MKGCLVLPVLGMVLWSTITSQAAVIHHGHGPRRSEVFNPRQARQTDSPAYPSPTAASYLTQAASPYASTYGTVAQSPYASQSRYAAPSSYDYALNDYLANPYAQPASYYSPLSSYTPTAPTSYYTQPNAYLTPPTTTTTTAVEEYETKTTPSTYAPSSSHYASQYPSNYATKLASAAEAFRAISECLQIKLQAAERLELAENEFNSASSTSPFARNANVEGGSVTPYAAPVYTPVDKIVEPVVAYGGASSPSSYSPVAAPYITGRGPGGPLGVLDGLGLSKLLGGVARNANAGDTPYTAPVTSYTAPDYIAPQPIDTAAVYVAPSSSSSYNAAAAPYIAGRAAGGGLLAELGLGKLLGGLGVAKGIAARGRDVEEVIQEAEAIKSDTPYVPSNVVEGENHGNKNHLDKLLAAVLGHTHTFLGRAHGGGEGGGHHGGHHGRATYEDTLTSYDSYIDGSDGYGDQQYEDSTQYEKYNAPTGYLSQSDYQGLDSPYNDGYNVHSANNNKGYAATDYNQQYF